MEKTKGEILAEKLFDKKENGWLKEDDTNNIMDFAEGYMAYLNKAKTERLFIKNAKKDLEAAGFQDINKVDNLKPGDKVYYINRDKGLFASVIGDQDLEFGMQLVGAHVDSPRLDLRPNPLYESDDMAFFKTRYYGGIKTYQWTTIPLNLYGVITKANGEIININIGNDPDDPVFVITDLLPHLAYKQEKKTLGNGIDGEDLNILIGSIPFKDDKVSNAVKLNILNILNKKYGITERDFISAELELVPAFEARSLGFDKSMVAAYGQDDKVCAYTSLKAIINLEKVNKTATLILADKEEIGSMGNTGMYSNTFEYYINLLLEKTNQNDYNKVNTVLCHSKLLSADVTAAYDPNFADVFEKNNESYINKGVSINKYTGGNGKGGASDANSEFVGYIRGILEKNKITYQLTDMGKIGMGGGGTIAYILANRGMDVIDLGIPVLSMHSPYEVTSKFDVYMAYLTYKAFLED